MVVYNALDRILSQEPLANADRPIAGAAAEEELANLLMEDVQLVHMLSEVDMSSVLASPTQAFAPAPAPASATQAPAGATQAPAGATQAPAPAGATQAPAPAGATQAPAPAGATQAPPRGAITHVELLGPHGAVRLSDPKVEFVGLGADILHPLSVKWVLSNGIEVTFPSQIMPPTTTAPVPTPAAAPAAGTRRVRRHATSAARKRTRTQDSSLADVRTHSILYLDQSWPSAVTINGTTATVLVHIVNKHRLQGEICASLRANGIDDVADQAAVSAEPWTFLSHLVGKPMVISGCRVYRRMAGQKESLPMLLPVDTGPHMYANNLMLYVCRDAVESGACRYLGLGYTVGAVKTNAQSKDQRVVVVPEGIVYGTDRNGVPYTSDSYNELLGFFVPVVDVSTDTRYTLAAVDANGDPFWEDVMQWSAYLETQRALSSVKVRTASLMSKINLNAIAQEYLSTPRAFFAELEAARADGSIDAILRTQPNNGHTLDLRCALLVEEMARPSEGLMSVLQGSTISLRPDQATSMAAFIRTIAPQCVPPADSGEEEELL